MKIPVGQENLKKQLLYLIASGNFPNTIIFAGAKGQGKRTIVNWLATYLKAPVHEPETLKVDDVRAIIADARTLSSPKVYLLADAETMTVQAQNALLKLAEEPPENAHIILTVADENSLLPTIFSRSSLFRMEPYTTEELMTFSRDELLLKIAQNPGQIQRLGNEESMNLLKHCQKVVANIGIISAANAFNILKAIDKEKFDLLIPMMLHAYGEQMQQGATVSKQVQVLYETKRNLDRSKSINIQNALETMFIRLREAARSEVQ